MADTSDSEKLNQALADLKVLFGSFENILEAFGLLHMPAAQRYGIFFGIMTFVVTVSTVFCLLAFGGSFERLAEQAKEDFTIPHTHTARAERALLLERLLDARERMLQYYPSAQYVTKGFSGLTMMLLNDHAKLVLKTGSDKKKKEAENTTLEYPEGYQDNYQIAYRKCQDAPGGAALSGRPESHFESFARAFASCGTYTNLSYRRSYARLYEAVSCQNHDTDDKYATLYKERPQDLVGKTIRLEALEVDRHLEKFFKLTSGEADTETLSYDPEEIWGFIEEGPFRTKEAMRKSCVFQRKIDEAAFAIINNVTDKVVGVVILKNDNPQSLSIQMEAPIIRPVLDGSKDQLEACFMLQDRLFALGYRRIQMAVDAQDGTLRKLAIRLGFTLEGTMYKDMIVKDASRDSAVYGILNSDWDRGARIAMYGKLYGKAAAAIDLNMRTKEEETDVQNKFLAEEKAKEEADKKDKKN